jgi:eukaryotic-like serine/threonine-protein kinase
VISASGGETRTVTSGETVNVVASWSSDGRWIYFTSNRSGTEEVWKIPSTASEGSGSGIPVQVTHHGGTSSFESPDGKTLYFTKTNARFDFSLWNMPLNGGEETEVLDSLHRYNFAVIGKAIFFTTPSRSDFPAEVKRLDLVTGKITSLYKLTKRIDLGLAISPDARYLLFAQLDSIGADLMSVENFH